MASNETERSAGTQLQPVLAGFSLLMGVLVAYGLDLMLPELRGRQGARALLPYFLGVYASATLAVLLALRPASGRVQTLVGVTSALALPSGLVVLCLVGVLASSVGAMVATGVSVLAVYALIVYGLVNSGQ